MTQRKFPFLQVDAFTTTPLGGNPCAIVFESDNLDDATMLAITREMNLSETSFVRRSPVADFGVRYFTPAGEIPLAGHPTIATAYALVDTGRFALQGEVTHLVLELQVGPIPIEIYAQGGKPARMVMTQKKPQFLQKIPWHEALPIFGLYEQDALPDAPLPQVVSTGTPQLMIPVRSLEALRQVDLDIHAYLALRQKYDFFSAHLFCLEGITRAGDTFARHFAVPPDLLEDPFTGSASGGMGAYLWHYGLIDKTIFHAEQGHWMHRPGLGTVEVIGSREDIETVKVGGPAVTVLRGELVI